MGSSVTGALLPKDGRSYAGAQGELPLSQTYTIRILYSVSAERQIPVLRQGDPKFELSLGCVARLCFNNRNYSLKTID